MNQMSDSENQSEVQGLHKTSTVRVLCFSVAEILSKCSTQGVASPTSALKINVNSKDFFNLILQFIPVLFP